VRLIGSHLAEKMSAPPSFGDLGKEAKETLLRGLDFSTKPTVDFTATSANGVKSIAKISREDNGSLLGNVEVKFPKSNGVESSVNLDTTQKIKFNVSASDKLAQGLKATFGSDVDAAANTKVAKATLEYKRPNLSTSASFNFPVKPADSKDAEGPTLNASIVAGFDKYGVSAGAEAEVSLASQSLNFNNFTLAYRNGNFVTTAFSRNRGGKKPSFVCGGTFYARLSPGSAFANAEAAAEIQFEPANKDKTVKVTLGGAYDVNADSRLAAALDTNGVLLAQLSHRLNKNTKLKLGTSALPLEAAAAPKFFAGVSFSD
jgi:voltage-dependent anion channel protein 2